MTNRREGVAASSFLSDAGAFMDTRIEQRLQDMPRFLMVSADEAVVLGLPIMMGLLGRQAVLGVVAGVAIWALWKRLKGDDGIEGLLAACYWYLPSELRIFKELPDSSIAVWEA